MRRNGLMTWVVLAGLLLAATGCVSQAKYDDLKAQNRTQQARLDELQSELNDCNLNLDQRIKELAAITGKSGADLEAKIAYIASLESDIEAKKALIAKLQAQLLQGGAPLPPELNTMLNEFARNNPDLVTFDEATGSLKFKSDLLFASGSDQVSAGAVASLKTLAGIMNSAEAKDFDLLIVGHTDDQPIVRSKAAHPTNWHLSVHRAISVLNGLSASQLAEPRMCVKGYGEYKPIADNKPGKAGNPVNRRVEIFIVPSGK